MCSRNCGRVLDNRELRTYHDAGTHPGTFREYRLMVFSRWFWSAAALGLVIASSNSAEAGGGAFAAPIIPPLYPPVVSYYQPQLPGYYPPAAPGYMYVGTQVVPAPVYVNPPVTYYTPPVYVAPAAYYYPAPVRVKYGAFGKVKVRYY